MDTIAAMSDSLPVQNGAMLSPKKDSFANFYYKTDGKLVVSLQTDSIENGNGDKLQEQITLHVEVCTKGNVIVNHGQELKDRVHKHLSMLAYDDYIYILTKLAKGLSTDVPFDDDEYLSATVDFIKVQDESATNKISHHNNNNHSEASIRTIAGITAGVLEISLHMFSLSLDTPGVEELSIGGDEQSASAAQIWMLPHVQFKTLWDSLFYEDDLKWRLVRYVETMLLLSDLNIDQNIVTYNRIVLLHGPPGTGKTSLCHALAQRLSVRLDARYRYCQLVEINSHSLFSRWFSESGKLVMAMFDKIRELYSDPEALVFILIDEVESLAASRKTQGSEPSDAIRVVNAMLTQLDQLKTQPNVVVLTTSNLSGRVDLAFVDRADIKQHVGHPSSYAIYKIMSSCITELMQVKLIAPQHDLCELPVSERELESDALSKRLLQLCSPVDITCNEQTKSRKAELKTLHGLSGRTLRKLPFLTIAEHANRTDVNRSMTLNEFLDALERTLFDYRNQMAWMDE